MQVNLVYGPPGTGKTTELLSILEKEMKAVAPDKIAFVSFTRKGTYEGADRARNTFGLNKDDLPYFRTIHSLAFRSAGFNRADIIQKHHYKNFSDAMGMKFTGFYTEELKNDDDKYLFFNQLYRNNPKAADKLLSELNPKLLHWVTKEYKRFKNELAIYDFTDIIELYIETGESFPVEVAIIDEAQDLTSLQWRFIWKAFRKAKRIYIAGDDDQAIYEWSGADVRYFLNLKGDFKVLNKSWRLPSEVHKYALKVSDLIENRIEKEYHPNKIGGKVELLNDFKELNIDNSSSWMFLARNSWHLKKVEEWLQEKGIVYMYKESLSCSKAILNAIHSHSKIQKGRKVSEGEKAVAESYMGEGLKNPFNQPWYEEFTKLKKETLEYYRNIIGNGTDIDDVYIKVSTIHGVKGGQADNVVLLLDYNKTIYQNHRINPDAEMRCYYVGVTRAKKNLYLVLHSKNYGYKYLGV